MWKAFSSAVFICLIFFANASQAFATCATMCTMTPITSACVSPQILNDMCGDDPTCSMSPSATTWAWSSNEDLRVEVRCETVCCAPGECSDPTPASVEVDKMFVDRDDVALNAQFSAVEGCDADVYAFDGDLMPGNYTLRYGNELFGEVRVLPVATDAEESTGGCNHVPGHPGHGGFYLMLMMGIGLFARRQRNK